MAKMLPCSHHQRCRVECASEFGCLGYSSRQGSLDWCALKARATCVRCQQIATPAIFLCEEKSPMGCARTRQVVLEPGSECRTYQNIGRISSVASL